MKQKCRYPCYKQYRTIFQDKPEITPPLQIIFFDMDGVLANTLSSWRYIHDHFDTTNHHSVEEYLKGNIDDLEFIRRDVNLWQNNGQLTTIDHITQILDKIPMMPGAPALFQILKQHNIKTAIVSAGLDILAKRVANIFNIDYVYANGIKQDTTGRLTGDGILNVQLKYKDKNIQQLLTKTGIPAHQSAAIGNSCFDLPMLASCGMSIAFNPVDSCIADAADIIVEGKNLKALIPVLQPFI
jgi:phosphoserine phosphatase